MSSTATLRLHGYPVSNYFNIAHAGLIECGIDHEIVTCRASQQADFLKASPMGKIPVLQTPRGWIAETIAILEYMEDCPGSRSLYSPDVFERARQRQMINLVQMYIEAPLRGLYPGVFMGGENSPAVIASVRVLLDRSTHALRLLAILDPYLMGRSLSYADLFAFYCLEIAERLTQFVYGRSLLDEVVGLRRWFELIAQRDSSRRVLADFDAAFTIYLTDKRARYRPHGDASGQMHGA